MRVSQGRGDTLIRYIDAAESVVDRATTLTQRLLAFSRRQTLDPQAIHVNQLVASMGELIRRTVGPAVELKTVLAADVWDTRCDPHQLESALLNLAINARDAMPKGGRLTIETSNTMLFKPALSVNGAAAEHGANGEYVTIAVTDNGSGMTPEVAARAFDPFFTTKPIGQGTGLGLSMVFGFIKQSEGHVGIQSDPDVGTTVRIHLPRQASTPHAPIKATATRPTIAPVQNATVLVVDDELALRSVLLDALRGAGYTTLEAGDAPTALAMLRARPELDMLVTDVGLPGHLNGRQLAEAAIALRPGLRMLFITGYADVELTKAGMPEGAAILHKPFSIDAFVGKVAELMSPIHHRAGLPES
jgi:CheY-like chemotaxis protein